MEGIWYVVGFAFAGVSFVFLTIGLSWLISHRNRGGRDKGLPYECGIDTFGDTHGRFGLSFYIYALLFVAFDIEVDLHLPLGARLPRRAPGRPEHVPVRRDPAARPRLRLAQGRADVALTGRSAPTPISRSRRRPRMTPWSSRSSSRTRCGVPRTRSPTAAAISATIPTSRAKVRRVGRGPPQRRAGAASRSSRPRPTTCST